MIDFKLALFCALSPIFNLIQISQDHINTLRAAMKPRTPIHDSSPSTRRIDSPSRRERSQINLATVIETNIPIASRIGGA